MVKASPASEFKRKDFRFRPSGTAPKTAFAKIECHQHTVRHFTILKPWFKGPLSFRCSKKGFANHFKYLQKLLKMSRRFLSRYTLRKGFERKCFSPSGLSQPKNFADPIYRSVVFDFFFLLLINRKISSLSNLDETLHQIV